MTELVERLCVLSVVFGLALSLMPESGVKKLTSAVAAAALLLCLLDGVNAVDTGELLMDAARYRELSASLTADADALRSRLDRRVIEQECETYIEDKAAALGARVLSVRVTAVWSAEGYWLPEAVSVSGRWSEAARARLSGLMETELGIPAERQEWAIA